MTMDTKLKRIKAIATEKSSIGRLRAPGRRRAASGGGAPGGATPEPDPRAISFSLGDLRDMRISVVSKGVVVRPPKPHLVVEVTFEIPIEAPRY
jgi:hypothetical protein